MIDIQRSIKEIELINPNDEQFKNACRELAKDISGGNIKIHDVVTNLEHLLVSAEADKRAVGTFILSTILCNVQSDYLSSVELQFIASFYADRLKDHHQVIPAVLKGILAASQMPNNTEKSVQTLIMSLFDNVCCQQQQISDRYTYYEILKEYSTHHKEAVLGMGQQFILGLITSMDSERDPRCLLFLFTWIPELLKIIPVGESLVEEMFLVISCYFPVDFRSPPSLTGQKEITRDELAAHLNNCLCAIPEFDQFCVPLMLEKLDTALKVAKLDSVNLMAKSCETFKPIIYETFSQDIWSTLLKEVLNNSDEEMKEACLEAVTAVIGCMAMSDNKEIFSQTCQNMYDTLRGNLRPDVKLFTESSDLLLAVARGSKQTCREVTQFVIPILLNQYNIQSNIDYQRIVLITLMNYVQTYIDVHEIKDISQVEILHEVAVLSLQALQHDHPALRAAAFHHIPKMFNIWPRKLREPFYNMFKKTIIQSESCSVREEIIRCLEITAEQFNSEVLEHVLLESTSDHPHINNLSLYLEALQVLAPKPFFMHSVLDRLMSECANGDSKRSSVSFTVLRQILETNKDNAELYSTLYNKFQILDKIVDSVSAGSNDSILNRAAICRMIIGKVNGEEQSEIVNKYVRVLVEMDMGSGIIMLEGFLTELRPQVDIPDKYTLLRRLLPCSSGLEPPMFTYVCHIVANVLNKSCEDENYAKIVNEIELHIDSELNSESCSTRRNVLNLHAWVTKALLMQGSSHTDTALRKLMSLLDEYEETANTFSLIMDDSVPCLGREAHCKIRLLYRQQFFNYTTNRFSDNIKNMKPNYLLALGALFSRTPLQIIQADLTRILPLVVLCLQHQDTPATTLTTVLNTTQVLVKENASQLDSHIDSLLECFLKLATFKSCLKVRVSALRCLQELVKTYPIFRLLPHKQQVIFGLSTCLDDKKRLVRQQAVLTRSSWFLLDAPT